MPRLGEGAGEFEASGLRHGLPLAVIPLQVVAGFLESDRGSMDSGVRPENDIISYKSEMTFMEGHDVNAGQIDEQIG